MLKLSEKQLGPVKIAALYGSEEKFLAKFKKNDFEASEEDLKEMYHSFRAEQASKNKAPIVKENKPVPTNNPTEMSEVIAKEVAPKAEKAKKEVAPKKEAAPKAEKVVKVKAEKAPKVAKEKVVKEKVVKAAWEPTAEQKAVIEDESSSKAMRIRKLNQLGVSKTNITHSLKTHYSLVITTLKRSSDPEVAPHRGFKKKEEVVA